MDFLNQHLPAIIGLISALGVLSSSLIEMAKVKLRRFFNVQQISQWPRSTIKEFMKLSAKDNLLSLPPSEIIELKSEFYELYISSPVSYLQNLSDLLAPKKGQY